MSTQLEAFCLILAYAIAALLGSWAYFRRYPITRPPIGVFNLWDIGVMLVGIILVPYLYLALPIWIAGGLLALGMVSALYFVSEPVFPAWASWAMTIALAATDIAVVAAFGGASKAFFVINNLVLILVVIGLANLWAQSGMQAYDLAILAGALAIYDLVATWLLPLMTNLIHRLAALPFAPLVAWPVQEWGWLAIGLGDLLLAAVFPLVALKAFGPLASYMALAISIGCIGSILLLPLLGVTYATFPVMIMLGPLMIAHYGYWRRRMPERSTATYRRIEPLTFFRGEHRN